jgi:hypothetical protein
MTPTAEQLSRSRKSADKSVPKPVREYSNLTLSQGAVFTLNEVGARAINGIELKGSHPYHAKPGDKMTVDADRTLDSQNQVAAFRHESGTIFYLNVFKDDVLAEKLPTQHHEPDYPPETDIDIHG